MRAEKQTALPDGDYLMLADERVEIHVLAGRLITMTGAYDDLIKDQHDRDADESKVLAMARFHRFRDLRSERRGARLHTNTLWENLRFRFDASLISPVSYFHGSPPHCEIHYDLLVDFASEHEIQPEEGIASFTRSYRFVSRLWKDAIEALEPNVHEFFRHTISFAAYDLYDHYIFRCGNETDFVDPERSLQPTAVTWVVQNGIGRYIIDARPKGGLAVKRERLAGRHWVRHPDLSWPVVSRELASALLPLLPDCLDSPDALRFIPLIIE